MKSAIAKAFLVFLVMQAVTIPWGLRNLKHFGCWLPYGYASYQDLYGTMNPSVKDVRPSTYPKQGEVGYVPDWDKALKSGNQKQIKAIANREMVKYVINHPIHFIKNGFKKWFYFLVPQPKKAVWPIDLIEHSMRQEVNFSWNHPTIVQRGLAWVFYGIIFILATGGILFSVMEA